MLKMITLVVRRDLWNKRSCTTHCKGPQGEHFKREWGCTEPTSSPIPLGPDLYVDRCPVALFKDAGEFGWHTWVLDAVSAWDSGNFCTMIPPGEELTAVGRSVLSIGLAAQRDREEAEMKRIRRESESTLSKPPRKTAPMPRPPKPPRRRR